MASSGSPDTFLAQATAHLQDALPFFPMYLHLIVSALFPIYTGAHASLSRPSSAAKAKKRLAKDVVDGEEEDDGDKINIMEGMSNKDAIVLPVTAGLVLAGLYFLIMRYGADLINLILGWYFSAIGVYSVGQLANDALDMGISFLFPNYYASGGSLWKVSPNNCQAMKDGDNKQVKDVPLPPFLNSLPMPGNVKRMLWTLRRRSKQKYTLKAYVDTIVDIKANVTIINALSACFGLATIVYVNVVSKAWFLTNLQGFAVSYSALQLMSPTTFGTGSLILGALFCYDIWAVFFTPLMVTVAKNLDQPIKLVFPRPDEPSKTPGGPPVKSFSMLGLGDIVLPGIMIGLALRFDLYMFYLKKQRKVRNGPVDAVGEQTTAADVEKAPFVSPTGRWGDRFWTYSLRSSSLPTHLQSSFPKPYFTASMIGYVFGMLTTLGVMSVFQHAQPALLYLVPGVLVSIWGTALIRRELKVMWEFTEAVTGEQLQEDGAEDSSKKSEKSEHASKGLFDRLWQELWSSSPQNAETEKTTSSKAKDASTSAEEKLTETRADKGDTKHPDDTIFHFSLHSHSGHRRDTKAARDSKTLNGTARRDADSVPSPLGEADDTNSPSQSSEGTSRYRTRSSRSKVS